MISRINQRAAAHQNLQLQVPAAPSSVTASGSSGLATVSFAAPSQNGGSAVTEYRVTSTGPTVVTVTGSTSPITVNGLTAGSYTFTVKAVNAVGTGPASTASSAVTVTAASQTFVQTSGMGFTLNGAAYRPVWGSINGQSTPASRVVAQAQSLNLAAVRLTDFINVNGALGVADRDEAAWTKVDAIISAMATAGMKTILDLSCYRNLLQNTSSSRPSSPYTYDWTPFLSFVLNRVNTVSGQTYKSDPGIFFVAFAGETEAPNYGGATTTTAGLTSFFQTVSNYWRNQGGQQLLTPGGWLYMDDPTQGGIDVAAIAALPNIDFIGLHAYSENDRDMGIPNLASYAQAAGKPWVNEECGLDIGGSSDSAGAAFFTHTWEVDTAWGVAGEGFWNIGDGTSGFSPGGYDVSTSRTPLSASAISTHTAAGVSPASASTVVPLTRTNSSLKISGATTRLSGLNAYWFGLDDNNGGSPGTYPTHNQITNAVNGMHSMGVNLVRAHTIGISAGTSMSYQTDDHTFHDLNLDSADYAVYQAGLKGMYLMVPLTDNWNYYHGGLWNFVHWAYQQNSSGLTDVNGSVKDDHNNRQFFGTTTAQLRIRSLYKNYINRWLRHVNPYTGLAYKDDPTIAIVETGNEIYYAAQTGSNEWTQDIASYIKSIAPNKLVADGSAASGQVTSSMPGLTATAVDIVGGHYYPQDASYNSTNFGTVTPNFGGGTPASAITQLGNDVSAATGANRVFILGEYPWTRSDVGTWYSDIANNSGISGDMAWAFIANTDSGSAENHGGSFGSDDYPVHWPYSGSNETTYAPALATHITSISGVSTGGGSGGSGGGGSAPTSNLLASTIVQHCSATTPFSAGSASLSVDTTNFQEGSSSLKVTPSGSGVYPYLYPSSSTTSGAPVTAGSQYTGVASVRTTTQNSGSDWGFALVISFYTSNGSYITPSPSNQFQSNNFSCPVGSWTQLSETVTAPANAAYAIVQPQAGYAMNSADIWNTDEHGIFAGSSSTWSASG